MLINKTQICKVIQSSQYESSTYYLMVIICKINVIDHDSFKIRVSCIFRWLKNTQQSTIDFINYTSFPISHIAFIASIPTAGAISIERLIETP